MIDKGIRAFPSARGVLISETTAGRSRVEALRPYGGHEPGRNRR